MNLQQDGAKLLNRQAETTNAAVAKVEATTVVETPPAKSACDSMGDDDARTASRSLVAHSNGGQQSPRAAAALQALPAVATGAVDSRSPQKSVLDGSEPVIANGQLTKPISDKDAETKKGDSSFQGAKLFHAEVAQELGSVENKNSDQATGGNMCNNGSGSDGHKSSNRGNDSSSSETAAEHRYRPQKFCAVCGDKAIACNFNAVTCESCKAFFRRSAFKEQRLKCLFEDRCVIDRVTRRFCSKCRLLKCFKIGMKREWILTEEQKRIKRVKIMQNKQTRHRQSSIRSPLSSDGAANSSDDTANLGDTRRQEKLRDYEGPISDCSRRGSNCSSNDVGHLKRRKLGGVEMKDASTSCPDEADLLAAGGAHLLHYCSLAHHCTFCASRLSNATHNESSLQSALQPQPQLTTLEQFYHQQQQQQQHQQQQQIQFQHYNHPPMVSPIVGNPLQSASNRVLPMYSATEPTASGQPIGSYLSPALETADLQDQSRAFIKADVRSPATTTYLAPGGTANTAATSCAACPAPSAPPPPLGGPLLVGGEAPPLVILPTVGGVASVTGNSQEQLHVLGPPINQTASVIVNAQSASPGHSEGLYNLAGQTRKENIKLLRPITQPPEILNLKDGLTFELAAPTEAVDLKHPNSCLGQEVPQSQSVDIVGNNKCLAQELDDLSCNSVTTSYCGQTESESKNECSNPKLVGSNETVARISESNKDMTCSAKKINSPTVYAHNSSSLSTNRHHGGQGLVDSSKIDGQQEGEAHERPMTIAEQLEKADIISSPVKVQRHEYVLYNDEMYSEPAQTEEEVRRRVLSFNFSDSEYNIVVESIEATRFIYESAQNTKDHGENNLTNIVPLCDEALRRLIKTVKQIKAFKILSMDDQIILLKSACFKILILRALYHFDDTMHGWLEVRSGRVIDLAILKQAKKSLVYERHKELYNKMATPLRRDRLILGIMALILLFDTKTNLKHSKSVNLDNLTYLYILRKYLLHTQPDPLAKYERVVDSLQILNACNDEYNVFFSTDFQPDQITPLLIEIFDISTNSSM